MEAARPFRRLDEPDGGGLDLDRPGEAGQAVPEPRVDHRLGRSQTGERLTPLERGLELRPHQSCENPPPPMRRQDADPGHAVRRHLRAARQKGAERHPTGVADHLISVERAEAPLGPPERSPPFEVRRVERLDLNGTPKGRIRGVQVVVGERSDLDRHRAILVARHRQGRRNSPLRASSMPPAGRDRPPANCCHEPAGLHGRAGQPDHLRAQLGACLEEVAFDDEDQSPERCRGVLGADQLVRPPR